MRHQLMSRPGHASRKRKPAKSRVWNWRAVTQLSLVGLVASVSIATYKNMTDPAAYPIHTVDIVGNYQHVEKKQLKQTIMPYAQQGFFQVNVSDLKSEIKQIPWVSDVVIRRVWPDKLWVGFSLQQPVAVWNERALCNVDHDLFYPSSYDLAQPADNRLPHLQGPDGQHKNVLARYEEMRTMLASTGLKIVAMQMDARHAFRVSLDNGMQLIIGKADYKERLARFISVYKPVFQRSHRQAHYVDLRYSHGMAIRWLEGDSREGQGPSFSAMM